MHFAAPYALFVLLVYEWMVKMMRCPEDEPQFFDGEGNELIVGFDCCRHMVPFDDIQRDSGLQNGCDDCYDDYSDNFSIVRAMEKI
jgi:hypothetical protein